MKKVLSVFAFWSSILHIFHLKDLFLWEEVYSRCCSSSYSVLLCHLPYILELPPFESLYPRVRTLNKPLTPLNKLPYLHVTSAICNPLNSYGAMEL